MIGCGAGPACHGHVVVTHDMLGLTQNPPRFVPVLGDLASPLVGCFQQYIRQISEGGYPAAEHAYSMPPEQKRLFLEKLALPTPVGQSKPA